MLKRHIKSIRAGIKAGNFSNEASVSQGIVLRLLNALGWPTYDTQIVIPEYSVEGRRVDFALCHPPAKPVVFVEVKQIGQSDGSERQLFEYAFHKGVPVAILTDGQEWHFFLPSGRGDYGERRVYKLDLVDRELEVCTKRFNRYLKYESICSGKAIESIKSDYQNVSKERQIRETFPLAWEKLIKNEDDLLLEIMADQVESLCGYKPKPDAVAQFFSERIRLVDTTLGSSRDRPQGKKPITPKTQFTRNVKNASQIPQVGYTLDGSTHPARNGRDVLTSIFEKLSKNDQTFLERFAALPKHGRTRRYLARKRDDLYPNRPDLARAHSYKLTTGWWLGVNVSKKQIEKIVRMACDIAGLRYGVDLKINLGD